jgi:amino acid adenylation domain-containing protein
MQKNVLEYLEHTAAICPEKTAIADAGEALSFAALYQQARSIGTALARKIRVQNRPVAVLTERTAVSFLAFLGVLYSGNYYVPIDSQMPRARMERLLQGLEPAAILYPETRGELAEGYDFPKLSITEARETQEDPNLLAQRHVLDVDPAYMIYTSGSTGDPKGIVVSHRSVIDFADWFTETVGIRQTDVLGNQAPFFFDLSVKDLYSCLRQGATIRILPQRCFSFPMLLMQELKDWQVTVLNWSTAAFHLVANSGALEKLQPESLRLVTVGGEALRARQLGRWRKALPQVRYVNLYGPTEVTVDCTCYFIDRDFADDETIPIGRACENMEILLLDDQGNLVPKGQPGEICVRGSGLALGYWNNPEKTGAAFVQNPRNPHYRDLLYRTGDLAVEGEDGNLRFLSRQDGQIKHGGYRIELGEIETALSSLPRVDAAICFFDGGRDKLVCVFQGDTTGREIAVDLRKLLPKYMLPNLYRQVEEMPHTANGKLDRVRLRQDYDAEN